MQGLPSCNFAEFFLKQAFEVCVRIKSVLFSSVEVRGQMQGLPSCDFAEFFLKQAFEDCVRMKSVFIQ